MRIITKEGLLKEPTGTVYARYIPDVKTHKHGMKIVEFYLIILQKKK